SRAPAPPPRTVPPGSPRPGEEGRAGGVPTDGVSRTRDEGVEMAPGRIRGDGDRERRREPEDRYENRYEEEYVEGVSAAEAAREGLRQIAALTGKDPLGTTSLESIEEGWLVGVEVVEDHRIPASTDLLGLYEVELDVEGGLLGYRRLRRYQRGKGDGG
ncbi:MAG: gas vesicle protein, partial [Micromonospora sp.]